MADNAGPVKSFRVSFLQLAAPALAIINRSLLAGVVPPNAARCYAETQGPAGPGNGLLNWLVEIDTTHGTLKTGGAPLSADPYADGYCFIDATLPSGVHVAPLTAPIVLHGDTFSMAPQMGVLNLPVFEREDSTAAVILPIRALRFENVTLSPDGRCIGDVNPKWFRAAGGGPMGCQDDNASCPKWFTNGSLAGYVLVSDTCVPAEPCGPGDYCSTTQSPGGCVDSYWVSGTFAASAVGIHVGGSTLCR